MFIQGNSLALATNSNLPVSGKESPSIGNVKPQASDINEATEAAKAISESDNNNVYDFTNMSRREYNQLVKAGVLELGDIVLPADGIDLTSDTKAQMEAVQDEKMNFIDYYKGRISYRQTTGQSTENFQEVLAELQKLQGKPMSAEFTISTDVYA